MWAAAPGTEEPLLFPLKHFSNLLYFKRQKGKTLKIIKIRVENLFLGNESVFIFWVYCGADGDLSEEEPLS